jgi:hypothetical protein
MAFSTRPLEQAQISNVEGTPGTAEAATEVLFYESLTQILHDKVFHLPEQDRGLLIANVETPFQVSQLAEFEMEGDLYDRLMVFMACNAIRGNITPTQPSAGPQPNHYLWTIEPGLTTQNTPDIANGIDTFTLEYGGNVQAYETEYIFTTELEISGEVNEAVKFKWAFQGRQVTETTFTGALTAPTTHQYFAMNNAKWYVDTSYAGIGGTQKTGVLKAFTWTLETGFTARFTADGNYYYAALNEDRKKVTFEAQLWRDGTIAEAELDKFLAQTTSYQRLALFGNTEMDSGQADKPYIYLDMALKHTEVPELDDEDGTRVVTFTGEAFYDTTAAKAFGVSIGTRMSAFA